MFFEIILLLFMAPFPLNATDSAASIAKILRREYATFFAPMDRQIYEDDVRFSDPLINFSGVDAYQRNVDMLAGRFYFMSTLLSY